MGINTIQNVRFREIIDLCEQALETDRPPTLWALITAIKSNADKAAAMILENKRRTGDGK